MSHEPTGRIALPLANLRILLGHSGTWQNWTNADDAAEAKENIHLISLPPPANRESYTLEELQNYRPFALIDTPETGDSFSSQRIAETAYQDSGRLLLMIEAGVPAEFQKDPTAAKLEFLNKIGAVIDEMFDLSASGPYLSIHGVQIVDGPRRSDEDELSSSGDYMEVLLGVDWGV